MPSDEAIARHMPVGIKLEPIGSDTFECEVTFLCTFTFPETMTFRQAQREFAQAVVRSNVPNLITERTVGGDAGEITLRLDAPGFLMSKGEKL